VTLLWLVAKSLRQHLFSSAITMLVCALASGLVLSVFSLERQARAAFTGDIGVDAVLGARGSQIQLVLNSVFHLDTSPGNIPWSLYQDVARTPGVELAIPYAVGDNYAGYRIVGTTNDLFERFTFRADQRLSLPAGHAWFDPLRAEAVVGATVARRTGRRRGSVFQPAHGVSRDSTVVHDVDYVVTGVLEPTGTPLDRVIFIPIEGLFRMEGHVLRGTGEEFTAVPGELVPDEHKEVSAVLLKLSSQQRGLFLAREINEQGDIATLAFPVARVMAEIFEKLGYVVLVLQAVAQLVVVIGGLSILAALWNTMNERRREFAILRALGARRATLFAAIVLESTAIATLGCLLGYLVYGAVGLAVAGILVDRIGVHLEVFAWSPVFAAVLPGAVLLGALAGLVPAVRAYATEVAQNLRPAS